MFTLEFPLPNLVLGILWTVYSLLKFRGARFSECVYVREWYLAETWLGLIIGLSQIAVFLVSGVR